MINAKGNPIKTYLSASNGNGSSNRAKGLSQLWKGKLPHQPVRPPITIWVATEYFSTIGPELRPNRRFHQW